MWADPTCKDKLPAYPVFMLRLLEVCEKRDPAKKPGLACAVRIDGDGWMNIGVWTANIPVRGVG